LISFFSKGFGFFFLRQGLIPKPRLALNSRSSAGMFDALTSLGLVAPGGLRQVLKIVIRSPGAQVSQANQPGVHIAKPSLPGSHYSPAPESPDN
jgi:hypothetical protein